MRCLKEFFLFTFVVSARAVGFRGLTYKGLKELEVNVTKAIIINEGWIVQPVDHFNVRDNRTWSMRYYENAEFFNGSGPIFIMLGGEWKITTGFLEGGQMHDIAKDHGAVMYSTEHRYYGKSHPVNDTRSENLQYLSTDQALADVAHFIETKKKENPQLNNSSVIVFGGSYAGNLAAWARIKYPHLVQGAVASSAPVLAKTDFFEYYEVVTKSLSRSSKNCTEDINEAFDIVEKLLDTPDGPEQLKKNLNLCEVPDTSSPMSIAYFMNVLIEEFGGIVQYNKMSPNGTSDISKACDTMTNKSLGSSTKRLVKFVSKEKCLDISYDNFVKQYRNITWQVPEENGAMRSWYYQTCTEYGYFQTTSSNHSVFGRLVSVESYMQMCSDLYGEYYDSNLVESKVRRTNVMYGGSLPDVRNVVFVNGNVDPWHALSVLDDLNEKAPAILIDGSSHCQDLYPETKYDVPGLIEARKRVRSIVNGWLTAK